MHFSHMKALSPSGGDRLESQQGNDIVQCLCSLLCSLFVFSMSMSADQFMCICFANE